MKATGIVRRIDDLGRVVIPKEIRRTMRIREGDALGLVVFIGTEGESAAGETEYKLAQAIAGFLGKHMES